MIFLSLYSFNMLVFQLHLLPPHHLIHDPRIALYDLHHLGTHVLIHIVGYWDAVVAVGVHRHGRIHRLQEAVGVDARDEETTLIQGLGTLGARTDTHRRVRMTHAGEEAALLGECATVAHHGEGVHLQTVVVVEAQRLVLDDTWVQLEATRLKTLAATRMTAVEDRHVVLLSHGVDGVEETEEVLLRIDVLLSMRAQQYILLRR